MKPEKIRDTCFVVSVFGPSGSVEFELLLYGLEKEDIYLTPNPYVSQALNNRGIRPEKGYSVSPFFVEQIR